jgi:hypothetical protein
MKFIYRSSLFIFLSTFVALASGCVEENYYYSDSNYGPTDAYYTNTTPNNYNYGYRQRHHRGRVVQTPSAPPSTVIVTPPPPPSRHHNDYSSRPIISRPAPDRVIQTPTPPPSPVPSPVAVVTPPPPPAAPVEAEPVFSIPEGEVPQNSGDNSGNNGVIVTPPPPA